MPNNMLSYNHTKNKIAFKYETCLRCKNIRTYENHGVHINSIVVSHVGILRLIYDADDTRTLEESVAR